MGKPASITAVASSLLPVPAHTLSSDRQLDLRGCERFQFVVSEAARTCVGEAACVTKLAFSFDPMATQARFRLEAGGQDCRRRDDWNQFTLHAPHTIVLKSAGVTEVASSLLPVSAYGHQGWLHENLLLHGTFLRELHLW